jgi:Trypsin-like peptidase domain
MAILEVTGDNWRFALASHIHTVCRAAVDQSLPELAHDLPGRLPWDIKARIAEGMVFAVWSETLANRMNIGGDFADDVFSTLVHEAADAGPYAELKGRPALAPFFSKQSFLLVLKIVDNGIETDLVDEQVIAWMNDLPLEHAEDVNRRRVERALPDPPRYDLVAIAEACWVIESDAAGVQGTAFVLDGVGFVTCAHVVLDDRGRPHADLILYRSGSPGDRHLVLNVAASAALDLAVVSCDLNPGHGLSRSSIDDVPLHAHVAVCGFPNHRPGDTCSLSPGVVTAHRMRSGVRRILTNAGIVTGMSGGPALGRDNTVIGVCANGADYIQNAREVEDQSIVPIQAMELFNWRTQPDYHADEE